MILQSNDLGMDMTIATSLMEIGVIGAPLILAVCQFINNRDDSRKDSQTVAESVLLGSLCLVSGGLMWALYATGALWIWQSVGYSPTSELLLTFASMYFFFILLIVMIQSHNMVDERLRRTVVLFILGTSLTFIIIIGLFQGSLQESAYIYSICAFVLFVVGTMMYPSINSRVSNYIPFLHRVDEDNSQSDNDVNSNIEKEWWRVWNEEE